MINLNFILSHCSIIEDKKPHMSDEKVCLQTRKSKMQASNE